MFHNLIALKKLPGKLNVCCYSSKYIYITLNLSNNKEWCAFLCGHAIRENAISRTYSNLTVTCFSRM